MKHLLLRCLLLGLLVLSNACRSATKLPRTLGDSQNAPNYGYNPIDPLPVSLLFREKDEAGKFVEPTEVNKRIMKSLHDETMRIAIGQVNATGGISFGPAKLGYEGNSYVVILDYIKFDTQPFSVRVEKREAKPTENNPQQQYALKSLPEGDAPDAVMPAYVGVGLRLTASIRVNKGQVDLSNLFALGAAAEAKRITGTMVIQTLGLSGSDISALIPLPSEVSAASIQQAILSLASIKAKMYDERIQVRPRVVGVYNTVGGGESTINSFIAVFLRKPVTHLVD